MPTNAVASLPADRGRNSGRRWHSQWGSARLSPPRQAAGMRPLTRVVGPDACADDMEIFPYMSTRRQGELFHEREILSLCANSARKCDEDSEPVEVSIQDTWGIRNWDDVGSHRMSMVQEIWHRHHRWPSDRATKSTMLRLSRFAG